MPKKIPDEAKQLIERLLREDKTFAEVIEACAAAGHSVSNGTVANEHKRLGLPPRPIGARAGKPHKKYSPYRERVLHMRHVLGMSQEAIAAELGIKRQGVGYLLGASDSDLPNTDEK